MGIARITNYSGYSTVLIPEQLKYPLGTSVPSRGNFFTLKSLLPSAISRTSNYSNQVVNLIPEQLKYADKNIPEIIREIIEEGIDIFQAQTGILQE